VEVTPVADLATPTLQLLDHRPGDFCITRPGTRGGSCLVDPQTAALLQYFRRPTSIVDAILAFAAAEALDPRETLDEAFGVLASLVESGLLVPADSPQSAAVEASLAAGMMIGGVEIVEPVHVLDDTEVYRARTAAGRDVALKIAGTAAFQAVKAAVENEIEVLRHLDGRVNPDLVGAGRHQGRPYAITGWQLGVELYEAGADARALAGRDGRAELLGLAERILEAYAYLHDQGVLHGDVQPRNVLVGGRGGVTLLDFGLAVIPETGRAFMRGGVPLFQAPENARAQLENEGSLPTVSARSEQYSVAALIYLALTGGHTHAFSLRQDEMLRQLAEEEPLPFHRHAVERLRAVETCLRRALAREPSERYPDMGRFLDAFRRAAATDGNRRRPPAASAGTDPLRSLTKDALTSLTALSESGSRDSRPLTASVFYGGAGVAYALLRAARHQDDESLLAQADLWISSCSHAAGNDPDRAFRDAEREIDPEALGRASLFHNAVGVHCVDALVAQARGDDHGQSLALERFLSSSTRTRHGDLVFGRAGQQLGCAAMLEALPGHLDRAQLLEHGGEVLNDLVDFLSSQPPIDENRGIGSVGLAHGWGGFLYAILRWCEVTGQPLPPRVTERLRELAALGQPCGRGLRWPLPQGKSPRGLPLVASWCNGAAGLSQLWTLAHRLTGDAQLETLADLTAWAAYEAAPEAPAGLCCGFAGRAYALLGRFRATGDEQWLQRARLLTERTLDRREVDQHIRFSLFHGDPGLVLLALDLEEPDFSSMPLLEAEGGLAA
jgi:serine/threonine-protein kinase